MSAELRTWIEGTMHLLSTEEGGRETPAITTDGKYRPQLYVEDTDVSTSLFLYKVTGKEWLAPGESGEFVGALLSPQLVGDALQPNAKFKIREGRKVVGEVRIAKIWTTNEPI